MSLTLANILSPNCFQIFRVWVQQSVSHARSSVHVFVDRPLPLRHRLERLTTIRAGSTLLRHVSHRTVLGFTSFLQPDRPLRLSCRTAIRSRIAMKRFPCSFWCASLSESVPFVLAIVQSPPSPPSSSHLSYLT